MQPMAYTKLPKVLLYLEGCGGGMVLFALVCANQSIGWLGITNPRLFATIALLAGFILMLPGVIVLSFRTIKAMAPQLFGQSPKNKP